MKLQPDTPNSMSINALGLGWIEVNGVRYSDNLLLSSSGHIEPLKIKGINELNAYHFELMADLSIDIALLGTGGLQHFISPSLLTPLMLKGVGFESMDTSAASRTFNILVNEDRNVGALLFLSSSD